jgi:uncharacterized protein (TIGR02996 family)
MAPPVALLRSIRQDPARDSPRLAYADWLEKRGDLGRAEFIRLQCELARSATTEPRRTALQQREQELFQEYHEAWWSEFQDLAVEALYPTDTVYQRGFPVAIRPLNVEAFLRHGKRLLDRIPSTRLEFGRVDDEEATALAASPFLSSITELAANRCVRGMGDQGGAALAASRHVTRLVLLDLSGNSWMGDGACMALARSPRLARLTALSLSGCQHVSITGVLALASSPHLTHLTELNVDYLDDLGAERIASSPAFSRYTILDLSNCGIGDTGAMALAASPHLENLQTLRLNRSEIGEVGMKALRRRFGPRLEL